jgi:hypothetical protein
MTNKSLTGLLGVAFPRANERTMNSIDFHIFVQLCVSVLRTVQFCRYQEQLLMNMCKWTHAGSENCHN